MVQSFRHILDILQRREYGFFAQPHRAGDCLFRSLFRDKYNTLVDCCHQQSSDMPIYVLEDKVYFRNLTECRSFYKTSRSPTNWPELIYKSSRSECSKKLVDFYPVYTSKLSLEASASDRADGNAFYVLTANGYLEVRHIDTGAVLRSICLANERQCKYRHLCCHDELNRLYVRSVPYPRKPQSPNVVFSVIAFKVLPLCLLGSLDFTTEVFGKSLKQIDFNEDILITLHGSSKDNYQAFVYNFDSFLSEHNRVLDVRLGQFCAQVNGIVGQANIGIPVTHQVRTLPPVLLQVKCTSSSIYFSPLPNVFIVNPPKQSGLFQVYDLFTRLLIDSVGDSKNAVEKFYDLEDEEGLFLDHRNRLIYTNSERIALYNIEHVDNNVKRKLTLNFEIKLPSSEELIGQLKDSEKLDNSFRRTMPQRRARMKLSYEQNRVVTLHYNSALELFLVLASIPNYANAGVVLIYDAVGGELMLRFHTPFPLKEQNMYDIHMFYDMIFTMEQNMDDHLYKIYAFRLRTTMEDEIE